MSDKKKTREQLIQELERMRRRIEELEKSNPPDKQTTEALLEKGLTIQNISNNLLSGMIYQVIREKDGSRRFTYLSDTVRLFYGIAPEEGLRDSSLIYGRVHEDDRIRVFQEEEEANRTLTSFRSEMRMMDPTGGIRWSLFMSHPKRLPDGSTCWNGIEFDITERKIAEEALRQNEEKFSKIFRTSPDAIAIARTYDGSYLEVNESFTKIMGYSREELIGRSPLPGDLGIWTYREGREAFVKALKETGEAIGFEVRLRRKDGTIRDCLLSGRLLDIEGKTCHVAIITDITDRKQAEEALTASEKKYRDIFENALEGIFQSTPDGRLLGVNPFFARIAGFDSPDQMLNAVTDIGRQLYVVPGEREKLKQLLAEKGRVEGYEVQAYGRNKSKIWISLNMQTRCDAAGRILYFQGVFTDITERKRAEEALRSSEEMFSKIFKTIPDPISIIRLSDGIFMDVNESFTRVTGYSREEIVGRPYYSSNPDVWIDQKDRVRLVAALKGTGEVHGVETQFRGKDGQMVYGLISARALEISGDPCIVGIVHDITEQKLVEEALKRSRERLRALSARIQSVREEERTNISREIHDDLGQQLTGLKLDLGWMMRHLKPDQAALKEKAQAMGGLIDQTVRTVRRISTELRPRILDDFGLVAALEWQAEEFTKKTGISCLFQSPGRQPKLKPDLSIAVFRIFQETLTNVVRHSGATKVEASLKKDAKDLVLTIRDNGQGISDEEIVRSKSLGLVGMRERALIFGGTIEIKGKKGKGTTVILRLPFSK
jgi:PAS domain S-box-containing protein